MPAQILAGGEGGGLDAGVTAGSLSKLHGDTIALGRHRAQAAHAHVGDHVPVMLGDGTLAHATVVAIYNRDLAFGDALLARSEAALIITIGLGTGLAIAAMALLPLGHALNGGLPYVPARPFAAIVGFTAVIALLALALPTRHALHTRPFKAIGMRE